MTQFICARSFLKNSLRAQAEVRRVNRVGVPGGSVNIKTQTAPATFKVLDMIETHNADIILERDQKTKERFDKYREEFAWKEDPV